MIKLKSGMMKPGMIYGDEVKIKILSFDSDVIVAKVVEVNEFWSSRPTGPKDINFEPGMILKLSLFDKTMFKLIYPKWLPWFVLDLDGTFEHYR